LLEVKIDVLAARVGTSRVLGTSRRSTRWRRETVLASGKAIEELRSGGAVHTVLRLPLLGGILTVEE
jgi:hypothetical protein